MTSVSGLDKLQSMSVRLSKIMADRGICSRREADECIAKGWVMVDGHVVDELGSKINGDENITLSRPGQEWLQQKITVMIYKPVGYVSGQAEDGYQPATVLLTEDHFLHNPGDPPTITRRQLLTLAPAGRLDIDSRGLLILTQDGKLARAIISAESTVDKEYVVGVEGEITEAKLKLLREGLSLDGKKLKPAVVEKIKQQELRFILQEGKKRQIRRMCELVDLQVVSLMRTRIGPIKIGNLKPSQWRHLSQHEMMSLLKYEAREFVPKKPRPTSVKRFYK